MQNKYDRNMEDIERARMEERFWSARYAEPGFSHPNLYTEPYSLSQFRQFQQPFQQIPNPYLQHLSPYPTYQWNPQVPQFQPQFNSTIPYSSRAFGRPPRNYKRPDELIRDEICKRLAITQELDATDIEVIVKDGEVTLRGFVDDRFAKRLVEDITESTFGVRDVLNEVRVGSHELIGATKGKEK